MIFYKKLLITACVVVLFTNFCQAQLDNRLFYRFQDSLVEQKQFRMEVDYFGFFKNREYFEQIADGYTLFGSQVMGIVHYQLDSTLRFSAGSFLRKDFGNQNFVQIQPYFQFRYQKNKHQFIFGNLEGNLQHQLIEPLFDFENIIQRRLENGLQYRYLTRKMFFDIWVDWVTMIYPQDDVDEELHVGIHLDKVLMKKDRFTTSFPIQLTAIHRGGQINITETPLLTIFNAAIGNKSSHTFSASRVQRLETQVYGVFFMDNSSQPTFLYENGQALYINAAVATKKTELMLSYWRGNKFVNPLGGDIFSSVSRRVNATPTTNEPLRTWMMLRVLTNFDIHPTAKLVFRAEPYFNFQTKQINFSTGLYVRLNTHFLLKKF